MVYVGDTNHSRFVPLLGFGLPPVGYPGDGAWEIPCGRSHLRPYRCPSLKTSTPKHHRRRRRLSLPRTHLPLQGVELPPGAFRNAHGLPWCLLSLVLCNNAHLHLRTSDSDCPSYSCLGTLHKLHKAAQVAQAATSGKYSLEQVQFT